MTRAAPPLHVVLASGDVPRLYAGLSALVSTAAEGVPAAGLAAWDGLALLLEPDLAAVASPPARTPRLTDEGRRRFARSLESLRASALALDVLSLEACSASIEAMGISPGAVRAAGLDGITSMPRFLRQAAAGRLVFA